MSEALWLVVALVVGGGLGVFYFGGLWLTVKRLATSRSPGLLFFGSFVVRTAATLGGFYLVMGGRWERLAVCLAWFLVARAVLTRRLGPACQVCEPTSE